jgi:6-pyruvoyltetrahydropterin/6-carboxytetrahydropterin synthase
MPYTITRSHEICAGHRVCGHEGRCRHLHGHAYVFELTCEGEALDKLGRVIDFGVIKSRLCAWLEENWDHRMLIWERDPLLRALQAIDKYVVTLPRNPTAENLAEHMVNVVGPSQLRNTGVRLRACTVRETSKCSATYTLQDGVSAAVIAAEAAADAI